jgi:hypothetical protein
MIILLEKIKIAGKVQDRFVATINQTIAEMNAGEINRFAGGIGEEPRVRRPNTQRSSGFCWRQKTRHKDKPKQKAKGKAGCSDETHLR